jgi:hypothetical protein
MTTLIRTTLSRILCQMFIYISAVAADLLSCLVSFCYYHFRVCHSAICHFGVSYAKIVALCNIPFWRISIQMCAILMCHCGICHFGVSHIKYVILLCRCAIDHNGCFHFKCVSFCCVIVLYVILVFLISIACHSKMSF